MAFWDHCLPAKVAVHQHNATTGHSRDCLGLETTNYGANLQQGLLNRVHVSLGGPRVDGQKHAQGSFSLRGSGLLIVHSLMCKLWAYLLKQLSIISDCIPGHTQHAIPRLRTVWHCKCTLLKPEVLSEVCTQFAKPPWKTRLTCESRTGRDLALLLLWLQNWHFQCPPCWSTCRCADATLHLPGIPT